MLEQRNTEMTPQAGIATEITLADLLASLDQSAKLTFEVRDSVQAMQLFRATTPTLAKEAVQVELSARPASCKLRDRWLETSNQPKACCG